METSFLLAEFDKDRTYISLSIGISIDSGDLKLGLLHHTNSVRLAKSVSKHFALAYLFEKTLVSTRK